MTSPVNYIGHKIGMIEVTGKVETDKNITRWYVTCSCGQEGVVLTGRQIKNGQDHCGCKSEKIEPQKPKQEAPGIHPVINEFLYSWRKYAHLRTDQRDGPLPEARYCQIPQAQPERLEVYLRGLR
jgi:hypothetical protein